MVEWEFAGMESGPERVKGDKSDQNVLSLHVKV